MAQSIFAFCIPVLMWQIQENTRQTWSMNKSTPHLRWRRWVYVESIQQPSYSDQDSPRDWRMRGEGADSKARNLRVVYVWGFPSIIKEGGGANECFWHWSTRILCSRCWDSATFMASTWHHRAALNCSTLHSSFLSLCALLLQFCNMNAGSILFPQRRTHNQKIQPTIDLWLKHHLTGLLLCQLDRYPSLEFYDCV